MCSKTCTQMLDLDELRLIEKKNAVHVDGASWSDFNGIHLRYLLLFRSSIDCVRHLDSLRHFRRIGHPHPVSITSNEDRA